MGSKSRRRKAAARVVERTIRAMDASPTPITVAYNALSDARSASDKAKARKSKAKPRHVLVKESSGHSYIRGDRALPPMLEPHERKESRKVWKERKGKLKSQGGHYHPDDSGERLVSGRVIDPNERTRLDQVTTRVDPTYTRAVKDVAWWKNNATREVGQRKLYAPRPAHEYKDGYGN